MKSHLTRRCPQCNKRFECPAAEVDTYTACPKCAAKNKRYKKQKARKKTDADTGQ